MLVPNAKQTMSRHLRLILDDVVNLGEVNSETVIVAILRKLGVSPKQRAISFVNFFKIMYMMGVSVRIQITLSPPDGKEMVYQLDGKTLKRKEEVKDENK